MGNLGLYAPAVLQTGDHLSAAICRGGTVVHPAESRAARSCSNGGSDSATDSYRRAIGGRAGDLGMNKKKPVAKLGHERYRQQLTKNRNLHNASKASNKAPTGYGRDHQGKHPYGETGHTIYTAHHVYTLRASVRRMVYHDPSTVTRRAAGHTGESV